MFAYMEMQRRKFQILLLLLACRPWTVYSEDVQSHPKPERSSFRRGHSTKTKQNDPTSAVSAGGSQTIIPSFSISPAFPFPTSSAASTQPQPQPQPTVSATSSIRGSMESESSAPSPAMTDDQPSPITSTINVPLSSPFLSQETTPGEPGTSADSPAISTTSDGTASEFTMFSTPTPTQTPTLDTTEPTSSPNTTISPSVAAASRPNHAGAIAGGVIGGIIFLTLLILGFIFWRRRQRRLRVAPSAEFMHHGRYRSSPENNLINGATSPPLMRDNSLEEDSPPPAFSKGNFNDPVYEKLSDAARQREELYGSPYRDEHGGGILSDHNQRDSVITMSGISGPSRPMTVYGV